MDWGDCDQKTLQVNSQPWRRGYGAEASLPSRDADLEGKFGLLVVTALVFSHIQSYRNHGYSPFLYCIARSCLQMKISTVSIYIAGMSGVSYIYHSAVCSILQAFQSNSFMF